MLFSQRKGLKPIKSAIQTNTMDSDLRNGLWNCLHVCYWIKMNEHRYLRSDTNIEFLVKRLWSFYFHLRLDTVPEEWKRVLDKISDYFFACEWFEVYDFLEFVECNYPSAKGDRYFANLCNAIMESQLSGFRFVGNSITEVTNEEEVSAIEEALRDKSPWKGVSTHIETALKLLSDRKNPDYRNSIKESISAVESAACVLAGKKTTLADALKLIEKKQGLHGALKDSFTKLYGYTSDGEGIRHAFLETEVNHDQADARFMLIACSAFVNYLKSKVG
jgi:hypothetical protein